MPLSPAHLRKWADELEAEEKAELEAGERAKIERLLNQETIAPDDLAWLKKVRAEMEAEDLVDGKKPPKGKADPKDPPADPPIDPPADPPADPPSGKTRPGRKSGNAYDWTVDDDGNVVRDGVAHIYSGADEDDEVALPEADAA